MMELVSTFMEPRMLMQVIIGLAGFATIYTLGSGISRGDPFKERMKAVAGEKEKLRQLARQEPASGSRLRMQSAGGLSAIMELFNLQQIMQASAARDKLKMAGLRAEKNVYTFVLARLICPPVFALIGAFYAAVQFKLDSQTQMFVWMGAALFGYFLPGIIVNNMIPKRQLSIRRSWPDSMDVMLICIEAGMPLEPAMTRVAREMGTQSVPLAEELTLTIAELSYLQDRRKAFEHFTLSYQREPFDPSIPYYPSVGQRKANIEKDVKSRADAAAQAQQKAPEPAPQPNPDTAEKNAWLGHIMQAMRGFETALANNPDLAQA